MQDLTPAEQAAADRFDAATRDLTTSIHDPRDHRHEPLHDREGHQAMIVRLPQERMRYGLGRD
jgi:hypothetical protein